jgi:hypothetical protein
MKYGESVCWDITSILTGIVADHNVSQLVFRSASVHNIKEDGAQSIKQSLLTKCSKSF